MVRDFHDHPAYEAEMAVWGAVIYSAAIAMLLGYTFWSYAIAHSTVTRTVPYLFLVPVATGIIAAVALGETFGPLKLLGAALVLGGTTLVRLLAIGSSMEGPVPAPETSAAPESATGKSDGGIAVAQARAGR